MSQETKDRMSAAQKLPREPLVCLECHVLYEVHPYKVKESKFCSMVCRNKNDKGKPTWNKGKKGVYSAPALKKMSDGQKKRVDNRNPTWLRREGRECWNFKGDEVGYHALHHWISRKLGKPSHCEDCGRTEPPVGKGVTRSYFQWANISGEYKRVLSDWKRLCYLCHKIFDKQTTLV